MALRWREKNGLVDLGDKKDPKESRDCFHAIVITLDLSDVLFSDCSYPTLCRVHVPIENDHRIAISNPKNLLETLLSFPYCFLFRYIQVEKTFKHII